jgi:hypothetical protein
MVYGKKVCEERDQLFIFIDFLLILSYKGYVGRVVLVSNDRVEDI